MNLNDTPSLGPLKESDFDRMVDLWLWMADRMGQGESPEAAYEAYCREQTPPEPCDVDAAGAYCREQKDKP